MHVFSDRDERSIKLLGDPILPVVRSVCGEYNGDHMPEADLEALENYFRGTTEAGQSVFSCDSIRKRL